MKLTFLDETFSTSLAAAIAVPPVAIRSSTINTLSFFKMLVF